MRRRTFLRGGILAVGAPALLPGRGFGEIFLTPRQRRHDGEAIRLSSNENPMGIPPTAREAIIRGLDEANRYPGWSRNAVREALAAKHGVAVQGITLGNGSAEILQMGLQSMMDPALRLVAATPTYEDVFEYSEPHPWIDVRAVPLLGDFSHDLTAMEEATRGSDGPVLVYICNPNNPTGSLTPVDEVQAWIERAPPNVHFLVDEAYVEFVDSPVYRSLDQLAYRNPQVVVARTFSKVYGMAGIRLGYAVAHPDMSRRLRSFAAGTNCNHLALVSGQAVLKDGAWVSRSVSSNKTSRETTYRVLDELSLEYIPSHTNFLMHEIHGDLREYIRRMAEAGFQVGRPFPPMTGYNRVSMGLPEEMEAFGETLREFRRRGWI